MCVHRLQQHDKTRTKVYHFRVVLECVQVPIWSYPTVCGMRMQRSPARCTKTETGNTKLQLLICLCLRTVPLLRGGHDASGYVVEPSGDMPQLVPSSLELTNSVCGFTNTLYITVKLAASRYRCAGGFRDQIQSKLSCERKRKAGTQPLRLRVLLAHPQKLCPPP